MYPALTASARPQPTSWDFDEWGKKGRSILCEWPAPCYPMEMLSHFWDYCEHVASWWRLHHSAWLFAIILALCGGVIGIARAYGVSRRRWLLWVGLVTSVALFTTVMATFIMYYTEVLQHPLWFLVIAFTLFATLVSNLKRPRNA